VLPIFPTVPLRSVRRSGPVSLRHGLTTPGIPDEVQSESETELKMIKTHVRVPAVLGLGAVGVAASLATGTAVTAVPIVPADRGRFSGSAPPGQHTVIDMTTTATPNSYNSPGGLGPEFVIGTTAPTPFR
jgi:hypothetical protein